MSAIVVLTPIAGIQYAATAGFRARTMCMRNSGTIYDYQVSFLEFDAIEGLKNNFSRITRVQVSLCYTDFRTKREWLQIGT